MKINGTWIGCDAGQGASKKFPIGCETWFYKGVGQDKNNRIYTTPTM
jgi:hypothetical protein